MHMDIIMISLLKISFLTTIRKLNIAEMKSITMQMICVSLSVKSMITKFVFNTAVFFFVYYEMQLMLRSQAQKRIIPEDRYIICLINIII
jgi:hypothetical protein